MANIFYDQSTKYRPPENKIWRNFPDLFKSDFIIFIVDGFIYSVRFIQTHLMSLFCIYSDYYFLQKKSNTFKDKLNNYKTISVKCGIEITVLIEVGWGGVNPKHIRTKKLRVWLF
jgi:hypothetical protein